MMARILLVGAAGLALLVAASCRDRQREHDEFALKVSVRKLCVEYCADPERFLAHAPAEPSSVCGRPVATEQFDEGRWGSVGVQFVGMTGVGVSAYVRELGNGQRALVGQIDADCDDRYASYSVPLEGSDDDCVADCHEPSNVYGED
jgi:hypothetical protein